MMTQESYVGNSRSLPSVVLSIAFLMTGVATGLLGSVLPVLLTQWSISDRRGGLLLLLAWGGSTGGAFLCSGSQRICTFLGLLLTGVALLALAAERGGVLPLFLFYGLGLGITMTSITLIRSQTTRENERRTEITRLNMLWSLGACLSPTVATHALSTMRANSLFTAMGSVFALVAIVFRVSSRSLANVRTTQETGGAALHFAPLRLYAFAALAVGVESALGGWLTTFAGRTAHREAVVISGTSAFWIGLLLSRAVHSVPSIAWLHSRYVTIAHGLMVLVPVVLLVAAPQSSVFLPCTLLAGFGLGPLYPQVLAMVLERYRPREIFLTAGLGSAVMPWLTGVVSNDTASLRTGLLVPCIGAAALLAVLLSLRSTGLSSPTTLDTAEAA